MTTMLPILLVVVVAIATAVIGQVVINHLVGPAQLVPAQETVGALVIQPVAGLYGVLVAFLLAGALTNFQDLRRGIANETNALVDLVRIADLLPPPTDYEIRAAALAYTRLVIEEWPHLAEGGAGSRTAKALADLWQPVATYSPSTSGDANLHAVALDLVQTIGQQHRLRLLAANRAIPALVWVILGFGGIVTIMLSTFSAPSARYLRPAFVSALAVTIALSLYTLYVLSHPFGAGVPLISPDRLQIVQDLLTPQP